VGRQIDDESDFEGTLVEHWNGSAWSIQSTPSTGFEGSDLSGIACNSASDCVAVGSAQDFDSPSSEGIIEHWNGTHWTLQASPAPAGRSTTSLTGVTCTGGRCTAVGWSEASTNGYLNTLIVRSS
jgi:hypothetical protein